MGDNHYRSAGHSGRSNTPKLKRRIIKEELDKIEERLEETKRVVPHPELQNIRRHIRFVKDRIGDDDE